jgi:hypothetical protein
MNRKIVSVLVLVFATLFLALALHDIIVREPDVRLEWVVVALCSLSIGGVGWSWLKPRHR